jgi:hypothetical protein
MGRFVVELEILAWTLSENHGLAKKLGEDTTDYIQLSRRAIDTDITCYGFCLAIGSGRALVEPPRPVHQASPGVST